MAEYILDISGCNDPFSLKIKKCGISILPLNTGLHYLDFDIAEDEMDDAVVDELRKYCAYVEIELAGRITNAKIEACRESLPLGFDSHNLPDCAILKRVKS